MNNKNLDDLKYLLEKYHEDAELKHSYKLSTMIGFVLFHVREDLKYGESYEITKSGDDYDTDMIDTTKEFEK